MRLGGGNPGIALVLLMSLVAAPARAQAPPLVQVSGASPFASCLDDDPNSQFGTLFPGSEVEPWVAVDPTDPRHIVTVWQQDRWSNGGSRGLAGAVSFDDGMNWSPFVVPGLTLCTGSSLTRASDPWISFSPNGDLHLSAISFGDPNGTNIVTASRSVNGGLTWSYPSRLGRGGAFTLHDKEAITADPVDPNLVYVVWDFLDGFNNIGPTLLARSTNGGSTWEPSRPIHDPGQGSQTIGNQIVVLPDGTVIAFFIEIVPLSGRTSRYDLAYKLSRDHGTTWEPARRAGRVAEIAPLHATDPETRQKVRDGAEIFDVAVDPATGWIDLVWQDGDLTPDAIPAIAFTMSKDGGATWSTPIAVNRTPPELPAADRQAFTPAVHVTRDGWIGVSYYDFRSNGPEPETLTDRWLALCNPMVADCTRADRWIDEARLTDLPFDLQRSPIALGSFLGDYEGLTSAGPDFIALFSMPHDADSASAFLRRIPPPGTARMESAAFWEAQVVAASKGRTASEPKASLVAYLREIRTIYDLFDKVRGLGGMRNTLRWHGSSGREALRSELLALLLNLTSRRLSPSVEVKAGLSVAGAVRDLIAVALDRSASTGEVEAARALAAAINGGAIPIP